MRPFVPLLLAAVSILAGCGSRSQTARISAEFEPLIPSDTVHLIGVRMEEIRTSPLLEKLAIGGRQSATLDRFIQETGVDPLRDIHDVLAANDGKNTLLMVRGKFQPAAIETKLTAKGATRLSHGGRTLFGGEQFAMTMMSDSLVVAGPASLLRSTLDRRGKREPLPERLAALVRSVPAGHQVWAVSLGRLPELDLPERGNLQNLERAFAAIDTAVASADLSRGLKLAVTANYTGEAEAKQVYGALRGIIGLGRLMTPPDKAELLRFYDAFIVAHEGKTLRVNADVATDLLTKVLAQLEGFQGR